ncbi:MAG: sigma-70 family RNA polymerase sigma factor [Reyranella sp.]|nr:sigma-70 family RNA polymerase sigma factor [Reyranella sp.]
MSLPQTLTGDFHADLEALLPRLRVYALSLTRDRDRADDLVQETVVKSLAGRQSFRPGTNLAAWLFRIQRNEFISGLRRQRPTVCLDEATANKLSHEPAQDSGLIMREFTRAFRFLNDGQREALLLSVLEGWSYQQIAALSGVSVGTVKSRISRGRAALDRMLTGDDSTVGGVVWNDTGTPAIDGFAAAPRPVS